MMYNESAVNSKERKIHFIQNYYNDYVVCALENLWWYFHSNPLLKYVLYTYMYVCNCVCNNKNTNRIGVRHIKKKLVQKEISQALHTK